MGVAGERREAMKERDGFQMAGQQGHGSWGAGIGLVGAGFEILSYFKILMIY